MQLIISSPRYSSDGASRAIIEFLQQQFGDDDDFVVYYDYPIYSDYERALYKPDLCIWSLNYGFIPIRIFSSVLAEFSGDALSQYDGELSEFSSLLFSKFVKSRLLRKGVSGLKFDIHPVIYIQEQTVNRVTHADLTSEVASSLETLKEIIDSHKVKSSDQDIFDEVRSIIEGAKALASLPKASISESTGAAAIALLKLEQEIHNFDINQRRVAISLVPGPHRIRGLAGSGKTIILAAKIALVHLAEPQKEILVTYYTRSLRETLRNLISRFYRHVRDDDPDWDKIHVRHGWGNASTPGVYRDACKRASILPLSFRDAQMRSRSQAGQNAPLDAFNYACKVLNQTKKVQPAYDYIFIDEGQDFPDSFYQLCYSLARDSENEKNIVWAYDELQNILNIEIRSAEVLFGQENGRPRLSLERASIKLPAGQTNDSVLQKCYRNQREVLVTAHALGFGLYSDQIVQMLESIKHWEDVGYQLVSGEYVVGKQVVLERPTKNSPISISTNDMPIIDHFLADEIRLEVNWAAETAARFIQDGLLPHHVMIITLDDRNAQTYLRAISSRLGELDILSNNLLADRYSDPAFWIENMVTLSTVYRAKGNEAPLVIIVGMDAVNRQIRADRNKIFTAFTRSKAWLRISGIGPNAANYFNEIKTAVRLLPNLEFRMPDLRQVNLIQRDLSEKTEKLKKAREEYLAQLDDIGMSEDEALETIRGFNNEPKRL
ncbi:MAG: DEAD/DEAH box helicase [Xanthobacteraceae bacterium]|nr:DEAD/DEAH box helicase [Xanthobacteraceae bacterium]